MKKEDRSLLTRRLIQSITRKTNGREKVGQAGDLVALQIIEDITG